MPFKLTFVDWLKSELRERDWSQSDLAREAGVTRSAINGIITGNRGAGVDLLRAIAKAFKYPPDTVYRAAGLLPPTDLQNEQIIAIVHKFTQLSPYDQRVIEALIDALLINKMPSDATEYEGEQ